MANSGLIPSLIALLPDNNNNNNNNEGSNQEPADLKSLAENMNEVSSNAHVQFALVGVLRGFLSGKNKKKNKNNNRIVISTVSVPYSIPSFPHIIPFSFDM